MIVPVFANAFELTTIGDMCIWKFFFIDPPPREGEASMPKYPPMPVGCITMQKGVLKKALMKANVHLSEQDRRVPK